MKEGLPDVYMLDTPNDMAIAYKKVESKEITWDGIYMNIHEKVDFTRDPDADFKIPKR